MNIIKSLRKDRKISQQVLASAVGVSRSTIAMWETAGSQPDVEALNRLADYFGVTVDYLLGREEILPEAQKNIPTPEGEDMECVSISIPMQKQLYGIYHAAVEKLKITDGFAVTRAGLRTDILNRMKNGMCSMSSKRDLLAIASVLGIESEILPLVSSLPPLEGGLLEVYLELHGLVDGIPPEKIQTVRDVLAAFSENRAE